MRPKVLLIEDDHLAQKIAYYNLIELDCDVEKVNNGMDALVSIKKPFDLILLDIGLPDINGLVLARHIRQHAGPNQQTPLIALTAHVMESDRSVCLEAGMDDYLQKPMAKLDLQRILEEYCVASEGA